MSERDNTLHHYNQWHINIIILMKNYAPHTDCQAFNIFQFYAYEIILIFKIFHDGKFPIRVFFKKNVYLL
ncbi:hypothetical protein D4100_18965 [Serratia inhibens]|uniref:Uncharacterized protein n=1 Tax=Serratia inhibens TaxID=2338073 RepID=A0AA92X4E1_9GAMM|nr:hypothetical protein D4100_18965 [Serratia inhibens]